MKRNTTTRGLAMALLLAATAAAGLPSNASADTFCGSVDAFSDDVFLNSLVFRGGQYAAIYVEGDGDTDLDCAVYDENGNLIASDTDYTDSCLLEWQPRWTGPFTLAISNLGPVYNNYCVETT